MSEDFNKNQETNTQETGNAQVSGLFEKIGQFASKVGGMMENAGQKLDQKVDDISKQVETTVNSPEFIEKKDNLKSQVSSFADKAADDIAKGVTFMAEGASKLFSSIRDAVNEAGKAAQEASKAAEEKVEEAEAEAPSVDEAIDTVNKAAEEIESILSDDENGNN